MTTKKPKSKVKISKTTKTLGVDSNSAKKKKKVSDSLSPSFRSKQRKFRVRKAMQENASLSSRTAVKKKKQDYRQAQEVYRTKAEQHNQLKQSLIASEEDDSITSTSSETTPQQKVRAKAFTNQKLKKELVKAKTDKDAAKEDVKVAKAAFKKTKAADPTRVSNQANRIAVHHAKRKAEDSFADESTLSEAVKIRQDSRRRSYNYQTTKFVVNNANRMNMKLVKGSYGLTNKSYNFVRGRGFQQTPEELSKVRQAAKRARHFRNQLSASKFGQAAKGTKKVAASVAEIINSPLKAKSLAILGGVMLFIAIIFMFIPLFTPFPIQQDEFELTESWTHLTKVDADRSDDVYSFYTPLDDVMFYMNYEHEDYALDDRMAILTFKTYRDHLSTIWEAMNDTSSGSSLKFTSMLDLLKDKDSEFYMEPDDFEEMTENAEELGYSTLDGQLAFPFETESLFITRRFGYEVSENSTKMHANIEAEVTQEQELLAPMTGKVTWHDDQNKVIISEENDARLILTGINAKRHESGSEVAEGEAIGKATGKSLTITYEKYDPDSKDWKRVNPGFYFPSVTYTQKTTITEPFEPGDSLKNAKYIKDKLTVQGYKLEGICAIIGNFDVESSINPKRAEGDYLAPPVGASGNSWDDPSWLSIGGLQIYGRYPNIIHRGLGLGQWTDTADGGTRHTLLRNFAEEKKKKWYSIDLQLDFMLNGDVPAARTIFKQVASGASGNGVAELTRDFLVRWEGNPGDKLALRVQSAQNWFNYFSTNPGGGSGNYILPLNPPNISSWFGWRSMGDFHRGIDFAHPQGTPIQAISDGVVLTAEYHYSWGNYVHLKHSNGESSLYAHCVSLNVKPGDQIKQGDIVGLVGNTGNSFGAHLHLEISSSTDLSVGSLKDPAQVLGIRK